jgi:hypothetical protein
MSTTIRARIKKPPSHVTIAAANSLVMEFNPTAVHHPGGDAGDGS